MNGKLISKFRPDNEKKFHIVAPSYQGGTKLEVFINCFSVSGSGPSDTIVI